jgi:hypothetical protein
VEKKSADRASRSVILDRQNLTVKSVGSSNYIRMYRRRSIHQAVLYTRQAYNSEYILTEKQDRKSIGLHIVLLLSRSTFGMKGKGWGGMDGLLQYENCLQLMRKAE